MKRLARWLNHPTTIRNINGGFTLFWVALVIPTLTIWSRSILWVGVLSIWANIISHYTAYLAARVEVREEHVEDEFFPPDPEEPRKAKANKQKPPLPIGL